MTIALTITLGLILGSFANVLIDRIPRGQSIRGCSRCEQCQRTLAWWELFPVVSAIVLRHRCRTCTTHIPFRLTAVELGSAALFALVLWAYEWTVAPESVITIFGLWALGILAVIDLEHGIVPDQISLPAILVVIAIKALFIIHYSLFIPQLLLPIFVGAGWFAAQHFFSRGRWVGDGDTRVGALMGALFALPMLLIALGASYVVGGIIAAFLLVTGRAQRGAHVPLVPFLFVGSIITVLLGDTILHWYGW